MRIISNTKVKDAPSGFRAYSKSAAEKINVFSDYSYTLETLIQAGQNDLKKITSVPINVNLKLRESRLFSGNFEYIIKSVSTIIRVFAIYRPFKFFGLIGIFFIFLGSIPLLGYLWIYFYSQDGDHLQSILLGSLLILIGILCLFFSFIAELISVNRKL